MIIFTSPYLPFETDWISSSKYNNNMSSTARTARTGSGSRKKSPYVSRACNTCRRRKSKCNGARPTCSGCDRLGHECTWTDEPDHRRPATKQYVETLRNHIRTLVDRVTELEAQLGNSPQTNTTTLLDYENLLSPYPDSSEDGQSETDSISSLTNETERLMREELFATSPFDISPTSPPTAFPSHEGQAHQLCLPAQYSYTIPAHLESAPCINFAVNLPADVNITRAQHDLLLDRFFKFFSAWCYRVIPELFLRDMHVALTTIDGNTPPRTQHYSAMLHNAILAVATGFCDDKSLKDRAVRDKFAVKTKSYIEQECQTPTLAVMQALGILASYHSGIGDQSLGFLYFGMSVRMTQALGLGADCSSWMQRDDLEERRWGYWMTFAQDKCWSIYVGRDVSVPLPRSDLRLPSVYPSLDLSPWVWSESNQPPQPSYVSTTFVETVKLFRIGTRIMDLIYSGRNVLHGANHQEVTGLQVHLDAWAEDLPAPLRISVITSTNAPPHILMMHLAFHWLSILLCRPFCRQSRNQFVAIQPDLARKRCDRAAGKIIQFLTVWKNLYGLRFVPITPVQVAFTAGTTFLLAAVQSASAPKMKQTALAGVEECIAFLNEMGQSWEAGTQNAQVLSRLLAEQIALSPIPSRQTTIIASPSTMSGPRRSQSVVPEPALTRDQASYFLGELEPLSHVFTEDPQELEGFSWEDIQDPQIVWYPQLEAVLNQTGMGMRGGDAIPTQPWVPMGLRFPDEQAEEHQHQMHQSHWTYHIHGDQGSL